ncbi:hypothetical protein GRS48_06715 [Halorubrum sp. JWXQ-INN 858]|uniref:hypothetical protein n=1 Tax=Halorubrum sp. JWXQ-INN 858 TaxID=2690782 RepID=UPI00135CEB78|nr:hypothetical protein [Halorubrum sp. JWXQ-INN 858]MWV64516.1 hypothetical protein [Halorubrum sp. JWXQ-INN 858]
MSTLASLPARPLRESEVAALNRSDGVAYAVATASSGPTPGLVIATDAWVKGLAVVDDAWTVVETVSLEDGDRPDALRRCERAVVERVA